uniref:Lymphocyte antigen 6H n=1 Tax=Panthera leo TaxID=9689 RepID=A0A8C8WAE2_PANLE
MCAHVCVWGGGGPRRVPRGFRSSGASPQIAQKAPRFSQGLTSGGQSGLVTAGRRGGCGAWPPGAAWSSREQPRWPGEWGTHGPAWASAPLLIRVLVPCAAHGLWCQDCTLTTNSSHCTPKQCQPSDTVCASVRITDPSSSRKDHSVNKMCASSCDFVKRHFFSDYLMGFINSGILQVDVDCCGTDLCNGGPRAGGGPWALAGGLLLSLGPALLWAGP